MKTKKLFILAALVGAGLVLTACGNGDFPSITRTIPGDDGSVQTPYRDYDNGHRIESITLEEDEAVLNLTEKTQFQIKATYSPSDAYDPHLYYTSDNPDIAQVDETGLVTMKDNGTANITVSCDQDANATLTILGYTPVTGIEVTPHVESETGRVFDIDVKDPYTFGIHYTPENTSQKEVIWSVVDENNVKSNIAFISEKGELTVSAPKGCNVVNYVVATSAYDENLVSKEKITIRDDRIYAESVAIYHDSAKVSESAIDLYLNEELHLDAVTVPEVTTAEKVKWISEDETTAIVDANGVVKVVKAPSTTKVYATIDGKTDWVTINTKKVDVTGVTLDTHTKELVKGDTFTLSATVAPDNASIKTVNYSVVGGHEFASVSPEGVVTALKSTYGTEVKIRATSDDNPEIYDECTLVIAADILIDEPSFKIACGGNEYQLTATTDPAGLPVVWSIDNTELATINAATGILTTNDSDLIGKINVTAKNEAAGATDTIELKVTRAPKEFEANKQYLVGNRDFTNPIFDYDNPSWDDAALALEFKEGHSTDPRFEAEWQLLGVNFDPYDVTTETGDLFKVRSTEWPENLGLNDYEKNKAVWAGETGNLSVVMKDQYNIYYQKLSSDMKVTTGNDYWVYMESSFTGNYYIVGNRQFNSGASEGEPGVDTSWNYVPSALKLVKDKDTTYGEQYIGTLTLEEGDEFRIRNENWFDVALGEEYSFIDINAENNFVVNTASTYNFYFKPSMEGNKLYISDIGAPVEPTGMTFLEGTSLSLAEGRSTTLTPVLVPENATYRNIVYSSDHPEIISVDDNGTLTAEKAVGTAKITAYVLGFEAETKAEIIVTAKANEFTWGIAHSPSWSLDPNMDFREIPVPDGTDAMYAYQASANLTKDTEWKVANTNNEWVNNVEGVVGIDLSKSTEGAFYITEGGNIKTLVGDTYTVTLLIWDGAEKDASGNFFSGVSIIATGSGTPTPVPTTPKYHYVLNNVPGKDLVVGKDPDDNPQLEALNIEMKVGDKLYFENYAPATPERLNTLALGEDDGTKACGFTIAEGVLTASKAGKFSFYVKLAYGHDEVYIASGDQPEPEPFAWGVAGSFSSWKMDNEHKFVESTKEGDALYTYKLVNYEFTQGDEWKVLNNKIPAEWVKNIEGTVGLDLKASTSGAVALNEGNIKMLQGGTYTVTLNIYECQFDGQDIISGAQIIVTKQDSPVPPVPTTTYSYKVNGTDVAPMSKGSGDTWTCDVNDMKANDTISFLSITSDVPSAITQLTLVAGDTGFTNNNGVLTASKAGDFTFTLTVNNGAVTITVSETTPVPVIPDYALHGQFGGSSSWTNKVMSKKDETEYQLLNTELKAGGIFSIHITGETWRHYADLKDSAKELQLVESDGTLDDNIKVKADGTYDIFVKLNYDEGDHGYIYIAKSPIHKMHASLNGGEWTDYDMAKNSDPEKPNEWTYTGDFAVGDLLGFKFPNDAWFAYEEIKVGSPAAVEKDGTNNNIKIATAGNYTFYVDGTADDQGKHIWIVKNDQPVSTDKYGLMINDTFDQFGTDGDSSYPIDKTFAINDVIKVAKTNGKGELTYLDIIFTKLTYDESKFTFDSSTSKLTVKKAGKYTINIALVGGEINTMVVKDYKEPSLPDGYYLIWNEGDPVKLGDKVDTELKMDVTVTKTGDQTFKVVDEKGTLLEQGALKIDILGTYTFCYRKGQAYTHGPTEHTYVYYAVYFSDNLSWGQDNIKVYLYHGDTHNGDWPGTTDYSVSWAKTDEFGKEVYAITPNAYLFAQEGSYMILSNNGTDQTIDIDLCATVSQAGVTGFYFDDQKSSIILETKDVNWWVPDADLYAFFCNGSKTAKWEKLTQIGGTTRYTTSEVDRGEYKTVLFARINPGQAPSFNQGILYNQTVDVNIPAYKQVTVTLIDSKDANNKQNVSTSSKHGVLTYSFVPAAV